MRLELTGRHVDITPALRRLVERKLGRLERLLNDRAVSAHVVLTVEKRHRRSEITLHARGEKFLHGVGDAAQWEQSVGAAVAKLTQQAKKVKGKYQARKVRLSAKVADGVAEVVPARAAKPATPSQPPLMMRASRQTVKRMSLADAARALDADGDGVVVFRDSETASVTVLFRRRNGDLALVEADV